MKILTKLYLGLSLALIGLNGSVAGAGTVGVPEMDTSIAALGLGLAAGIVTLITEYRRRK